MLGLLEENGIRACIQGEALWGARGELPFTPESAPSVWVAEEADVERARQILATHEPSMRTDAVWTCRQCSEVVETQFAMCWNCGTARDGSAGSASSPITDDLQTDAREPWPRCSMCGGTGRIERRFMPGVLLACGAMLGFSSIHNLMEVMPLALLRTDLVVSRMFYALAAILCFYFAFKLRSLPCDCGDRQPD
jgi:hypothetical protein